VIARLTMPQSQNRLRQFALRSDKARSCGLPEARCRLLPAGNCDLFAVCVSPN
jgi:hypothetical protein